jgi:protein-disulfide isomerase
MGEAKRRKHTGSPPPRKRSSKPAIVAGLAILGVAIIAGIYYLTLPPAPGSSELPRVSDDTPPFPAELDRHGISVGPEDAEVVVREFADYQCPACARFSTAAERLKEQYIDTGKVRLVFFDLPLRQHANAVPAAMAARCAHDQQTFWPMHKRLFERQDQWDDSSNPVPQFLRYAEELGMQPQRFQRCMDSERHLSDVKRSLRVAQDMRVTGTPTVFVENVQMTRPAWPQLAGLVERELNQP